MELLRSIKRFVETIIVLCVLAIAILNIFSSVQSKGIFGLKGYTVISASMEPTLKVGDYIVVKTTPYEQLKNREIISFEESGMVVTHRVVSLENGVVTTRGDNNNINDLKKVVKEKYVGTYFFRIPYLGRVLIWLQEPIVYASIMGLIALRLVIVILFKKEDNEDEGDNNTAS